LRSFIPDLKFFARTIRILWIPTHFAKNAKWMGHGALYRALPVLFFTALAVGIMAMPLRLAAQESAPAVQPAQASAPSEVVKSQEEQNNVFRLEGPVVKWTARTFHWRVETTANLFDFLNFGIVMLLIGVPLIKFVPKLLHTRGQKVRTDIDAGRKATAQANLRLGAIEAKLSGLDGEIAKIRAQVEEESKQDEARIKSTIGEESARIVAVAEQEIEASAAQARRSLRHFAADLAIDQAVHQLAITPETDRALIAEFLGDAKMSAAKGGQK
jgi:F-type H+-transporting ATPase subunit b